MLIDRSEFSGIDDVVHLSAGGESPLLQSHQNAFLRFMDHKSKGERARDLIADTLQQTRLQCAELFHVSDSDLTFVPSASDGINIVARGLDWQQGDNVVLADVEFGAGAFPWTALADQGVEIKIVRHRDWKISLQDIEAAIDERTRVVSISHVSMFSGQRLPLKPLSDLVRRNNAALVLDATHSAGVMDVDAALTDIMVSSCYKWLLGTHGAAIFYWNRDTLPNLKAPFPGWNSAATIGGWKDPLQFSLHEDANRFMSGNPAFLSLYLLNNALDTLLPLGQKSIEQHALKLSGRLHAGISQMNYTLMTPEDENQRAGNICIMSDRIESLTHSLRDQNILVWGAYGSDARLRISTHVYNSEADVDACLAALQRLQ